MSKSYLYRVRVLFQDRIEIYYENLSYQDARDKFIFLVNCCLEFPELTVRCVNIFKTGVQKSIKLFQNY